ncbi:MAG: outer rane biosis protein BamB, partial [Planctomycetaceae bacterium]|nr:outer rane biosis protein BamB [Planctomycetaceae bacterium]
MFRSSLLMALGLAIFSTGCGRPKGPPAPPTAEISASADAPAADLPAPQVAADDWPQWRGPNEDGISTGPAVPVSWKDGSAQENIVWKQQIPGRGHSSPVIVGDHVYVETADDQAQVQSVLSLSRADGKQVWKTDLFQGNFEKAMHGENTQASCTLAYDGERLFASFLNDRKIWVVALDLVGKEVWRKEVGGFTSKFGYSSSPTLYKSLVIIAADHQSGGFLAALNRQSGEIVWRKKRPEASSYASPRVITVSGKDELVICGCDLVASYDPLTGEQ